MANKKETQEVVVNETNAVALTADLAQSWDSDEVVEAKDLRIPRALLMQSTSEYVGQRKATAGDFVNSITADKIGGEKESLRVVPIYVFKTWTIMHKVGNKFEFLKSEPYTLQNSARPREENILGVDYQNVETVNMLAMLEKDLDKADALPYLFVFRMTSYACGRDILTLKQNCNRVNQPMASYTIKLTSEFKKNDKGQFFVVKYEGVDKNEKFVEQAASLKTWHDTFKGGMVKVHEEVEEADATQATQTETRF